MSNSARKSLVINSNPSPRQQSQSFLAVSGSKSPFANIKIDENFFGPKDEKKSGDKKDDDDNNDIVVVEEDDGEIL